MVTILFRGFDIVIVLIVGSLTMVESSMIPCISASKMVIFYRKLKEKEKGYTNL